MRNLLKKLAWGIALTSWLLTTAQALEVLVIGSPPEAQAVCRQQVELVGRFYGFDTRFLPAQADSLTTVQAAAQRGDLLAVVITELALSQLDPAAWRAALQSVPLLLAGISDESSAALLGAWTDQAVQGATFYPDEFTGRYQIDAPIALSAQLQGQGAPLQKRRAATLRVDSSRTQSLIQLIPEQGKAGPFWVQVGSQPLYVHACVQAAPPSGLPVWRLNTSRFLEIAPYMLLLRAHCGDRCWHSPGYFANLTIDDPWLTEPYGLLGYQDLLAEMEKANFHTTIGFVPWNYDRSETPAIEIFKKNPQRYSLSIHGNNHDHREFYKYVTTEQDPWPAKPLAIQDRNLQQALARMEKFQELTGVAYDRVFIFPHQIGPTDTLALLKQYNFLATFNGGNLPLEQETNLDPLSYFRPMTLDYANFTSVDRREPVDYSSDESLALSLFLGNPVLFFEHSILFADGIDAFNDTARRVNQLQPGIRWTGLGEIAKHLYVQRRLDADHYEVRSFTPSLILQNPETQPRHYVIRKTENFKPAIHRIQIAGQTQSYRQEGQDLVLETTVAPASQIAVEIDYENTLQLAQIDLSKPDSALNRLRWLSDFRDITFANTRLGQEFIRAYYGSNAYQSGLKGLVLVAVMVFVSLIGVIWWWRRKHQYTRKNLVT